jgi:AraC-like DNA-binding protein
MAMEYLGRTPPPPLDAFVERIWYCSDAPPQARERVLPSGGSVDLVVNLVDDEIQIHDPDKPGSVRGCSGAIVRGSATRSFFVDSRHRAVMVGVHFRPGRAFPFLGISPAEIVDTHVQLDDVWGSDGRNLREQLLAARSPSERFRLLEAVLLRRLRRARPGHPATHAAVAALSAPASAVRVTDVAAMVGLSRRRFIEVFEREVGLTPKLYARLQRYHSVKHRIAVLGGPPCWATFAVACGYFDQSHMIRDFAEFSSMSPASYLRCRTGETMFDHMVHAYAGQ